MGARCEIRLDITTVEATNQGRELYESGCGRRFAADTQKRDVVVLNRIPNMLPQGTVDTVEQFGHREERLLRQSEQSLFGEGFVAGIAGVAHAVGEDEQSVTRLQLDLLNKVLSRHGGAKSKSS